MNDEFKKEMLKLFNLEISDSMIETVECIRSEQPKLSKLIMTGVLSIEQAKAVVDCLKED